MRYEILGPTRIVHRESEFTFTANKNETLLCSLLVRANQIVSCDQLLAELWEENPPPRASAGLYVYISQVRKFMQSIDPGVNPIETRSPGYMMIVAPGELDLHVFQRKVTEGRQLLELRCLSAASRALEDALAIWHGPSFGGLRGGPIINGAAIWLEEARLDCIELLMETYMLEGRHRKVISWMFPLIAEYPLRETFYQLLMLALYRSGRQADALRLYQQARSHIATEIGMEPCRALRNLYQAILVEDESLESNGVL